VPEKPSDPLVSVIMAVRNEEQHIARSLRSILAQNYPTDRLQVLVADGMSTDRTRDVIKDVQSSQHRISVKIIDNRALTASAGLNLAVKNSGGEVVIRADGKCELAPDYIRNCVDLLKESGADNVGGWRRPLGEGFVGRAIATAITSAFGVGGDQSARHLRRQWTDTVYLGAWRRKTFEQVGLFDEEMVRNQDDEFNYRLRKAGGRILASGTIRSSYFSRPSIAELWHQYYNFGFWKVRVLQKHPRQMRWRQFVPPTFVCALVLLALLTPVSNWFRLSFLCLVGVYIFINLAVSVFTGVRSRSREVVLLPVVFLTLHLSYGSGFLMGVTRFMVFGDYPNQGINAEMRGG